MSDRDSILAEQEVDDELRRERLNAIWSAYGKYIIGLAILVVVIVAGNELYVWQKENTERENSSRYAEAIEKGSLGNLSLIASIESALPELDAGYATLAGMQAAAAKAKERDFAGAVASYNAIASSAEDKVLADLASLLSAMLLANEIGDLDTARSKLSILAIKGEPYYYSALEQLALIDLQQGNETSVIETLELLINDIDAPPSIKERANQLSSLLSDSAEVVEAPVVEETSVDTPVNEEEGVN
ncbi:tetratricopeptide repeat protein [Kordiimonas sp. SCSIO 12610]|uniref:tetratricopeptide repeat protein n=1 Tax=Kordiimonas sp. SCSIO 12610 TaxID=2829597 RepID=UPI00210B3567|nr:tetratricopeptide repeat protein [Kordiimonas sp. SCSIO 12610]UTW53896.1 tetratricopeptide repeat protein [Kordiimonas sp. SCSIO 12610]